MYYVVLFDASSSKSNVGQTDQYDRALIIAEEELTRAMGEADCIEPLVMVYDEDTYPVAAIDEAGIDTFGLTQAA